MFWKEVVDRKRKKEQENKCVRNEKEKKEITSEQMDEHKEDIKRWRTHVKRGCREKFFFVQKKGEIVVKKKTQES